MEPAASCIKIFARREAIQSWAEVTVALNESVAASKKAIMAELGIDEASDVVVLWKDGCAAPLDDRLLVKHQLHSGDSVILGVRRPAVRRRDDIAPSFFAVLFDAVFGASRRDRRPYAVLSSRNF
jgi:hypothetical protein